MRNLFQVLLISVLGSSAFADTSLVGTWKGPTVRCLSGATPQLLGISFSETLTFTESDANIEMTVIINGSPCTVKGSGTYTYKDGILSTTGKSISSGGPACVGSATLGSAQNEIEVVGNELRQTMPGPNMACPDGDALISVLIKQ